MRQKILVGVLILAMLAFILPSALRLFSDKEDEPSVTTTAKKSTPPEPAFVDQGDLHFVRGIDTIASIDIEIADSEPRRERGLMYRSTLDENHGMLFIFEEPDTLSFWMRNTYIPLDLLFVSADKTVVQITPNTPPYSTRSIPCPKPAQYVVEVNGGYAAMKGIRVGDQVTF